MTTVADHKFHTLDAMRGVAAIAVVISHFRKILFAGAPTPLGVPSGRMAVDLFFLLSGFVIAFAYDGRLRTGLSAGQFIIQRIIRLGPMIWAGVVVGSILLLASGERPGTVMLAGLHNALFLPATASHMFPTNHAEWSLMYEMIANFGYVLAFPLLVRRNLGLLVGIMFLAVIACSIRFGGLHFSEGTPGLVLNATRVGFSFFFGVLLVRNRDRWEHRLPRVPAPLILATTFLLLCLPVNGVAEMLYNVVFVTMLSPLLVMLGSVVQPTRAHLRLAGAAATISYPIYAIHVPVRDWTVFACETANVPVAPVATAVMVALLPVSWWLARNYDAPLRRRLTVLLLRARSWKTQVEPA